MHLKLGRDLGHHGKHRLAAVQLLDKTAVRVTIFMVVVYEFPYSQRFSQRVLHGLSFSTRAVITGGKHHIFSAEPAEQLPTIPLPVLSHEIQYFPVCYRKRSSPRKSFQKSFYSRRFWLDTVIIHQNTFPFPRFIPYIADIADSVETVHADYSLPIKRLYQFPVFHPAMRLVRELLYEHAGKIPERAYLRNLN